MQLLQRLKDAFRPKSHDATLSHYIPSVDYGYQPVELSVWRSDLEKPPQDFWGNMSRLYSNQARSTQGPLLFPLKAVTTQALSPANRLYGQYVTPPVAGYAGRPAQLDPTSLAAEYGAINQ